MDNIAPWAKLYENRSRLPAEEAAAIASFVFAKVHPPTLAKCKVDVVDSSWYRIGGLTFAAGHHPKRVTMAPWQRYYIRIAVGTDLHYPYTWEYRKRAGSSVFTGWDEEFCYLLAHETCHAMQFDKAAGFGRTRHYEVEAEKYAQSVLRSYREQDIKNLLPIYLPPMAAIKGVRNVS